MKGGDLLDLQGKKAHPPFQRKTLNQMVYEALKAMILDGRLPPNTKLNETRTAEEMGTSPTPVREAVIALRDAKLPDPCKIGSAGSFFKNPVVSAEQFTRISPDASAPHYRLPDGTVKVPAAWMIDSCGLKGRSVGGARVWEKQPLVIVNSDGRATAEDILSLEKQIIDSVWERFGVTLEPEVEHI